METTTTTATPSLAQTLDRLARMEPSPFPVISLYLNAQPDNRGKDNYDAFLRKELRGRIDDFEPRSAERESYEKDVAVIETWLSSEVRPSANGIAVFACSAADFFEALQLDAPIESHRLTVGDRPHLAPLARIVDRYPRHAVLVADGNTAHIFVFGRGRTIGREDVSNPKVSRTDAGGWSQMRYQRHVENLQLQHAKEVVEELRKIVAEERAEYVFLAGDEVIVPVLTEELPKELERKVAGVLRLDIRTPEDGVMKAAADALAERVAKEETDRIEQLRGEWRAGGLAVAGAKPVLKALENGQVDEVTVALPAAGAGGNGSDRGPSLTDEIVQRALATSASVRFVEDAELLADMDGVAARLRYKPNATPRENSTAERKAEA
jgi:peptide chain release factor subunit 1